MSRPAVDVVIPFRGDPDELARLRERLDILRLGPGDSLTVVDNTPGSRTAGAPEGAAVLPAGERATPAHARNRGAQRGSAEWSVFPDADTLPPPDLLDRYFDPPPGERTALLGGFRERDPRRRGRRPGLPPAGRRLAGRAPRWRDHPPP